MIANGTISVELDDAVCTLASTPVDTNNSVALRMEQRQAT